MSSAVSSSTHVASAPGIVAESKTKDEKVTIDVGDLLKVRTFLYRHGKDIELNSKKLGDETSFVGDINQNKDTTFTLIFYRYTDEQETERRIISGTQFQGLLKHVNDREATTLQQTQSALANAIIEWER